jgi:CRP-like cAMP-binding protein
MDPTSFISYDLIGLVGVVLYILAYGALQAGIVSGSGYSYTLMNMLAAALVLVSLMNDFNLSSAIIQITWIAISVFGLARMFYLHHSTRLNEEETALIRAKLPALSKPLARQFLDAGHWIDAEPGTVLAVAGEPLGALIYLKEGVADVSLDGRQIGRCLPSSFIGEMTCFDAGPATATVTIAAPARYFRIGTEALNRVCARKPELRAILEGEIGRDTRMKLVSANSRLKETGALPSATL